MCNCRSTSRLKYIEGTPEAELTPPAWSSRALIAIDACIANTIKHLWDNGVITGGCCCGHNSRAPSVVLEENQSTENIKSLIKEVDDREWDVLIYNSRTKKVVLI